MQGSDRGAGLTASPPPRPYAPNYSPSQRSLLDRALEGLHDDDRRFVGHVDGSSRRHPDRDPDGAPVAALYIRTNFRGSSPLELVRRGVLVRTETYVIGSTSRRYDLHPDFRVALAQAAVDDLLKPAPGEGGDAAPRPRRLQSRRYDANRHPLPSIVCTGMLAVRRCVFDLAAAEGHVRRRAEAVAAAGGPEERARAVQLAELDASALAAILAQRPVALGSGLAEYDPAYVATRTGRIVEVGGGAQGCTQGLKKALFGGVPFVHNYDLVGAHVLLVARRMEDLGMPADHLRRYAVDRAARAGMAEHLGVPSRVLKRAVNAVLLGRTLPTVEQAHALKIRGTLVEALRAAAGPQGPGWAERLPDAVGRLHDTLGPLVAELRPWFEHVRASYLRRGAAGVERRAGRTFVRNAAGMRFYLDDPAREGRDQLSTFLAHVLQGAESAVIHHLAVLGASYDYRPMSNQHDGLLTLGLIPDVAFDEAQGLAGERGLILARKAFE